MARARGPALAALLLLAAATSPRAGDYERMASQLIRAAQSHGRLRVAVLPFQTIGGRESTSGRIVSERLVGPLSRDGSLEIVERAMLEAVMREQRLQFSGVVDSSSMKELGKVLNVDALIAGTVATLKDDRLEVNARLIDSETAKVFTVAGAKIDKDWEESIFEDSGWGGLSLPPLPTLASFDPASSAWGSEWDCKRAEEDADDMERSALDLKARFWTQKLREGLDGAKLKRNPGSEIRNPQLRAIFYARLRQHWAHPEPGLSPLELSRLKDLLGRLSRLNESCHTEGS